MGDVITRFKLETTQYDSKLRDSAAKLGKLTQQLSMAGDQFDNFAKKSVEQARALGKIESGATNVKDRLKDLVGAYNNVAKAYNDLTDEQKKTDFGKAMAESLKELQGRITETKSELYELGDGAKGAGGWLGKLTDRLTVNIDAMKLFDVGMKAVSTAMDVAKDAFFANESAVDEWGRTVEASKSLYEGFLFALNTGDIGGYLDRIDQIVEAAKKAYDELDMLGTLRTIQAPQMSKQQAENARIRMMLMTGRGIEAAGMSGLDMMLGIKNGKELTPAAKQILKAALDNGVNNTVKLISNEVKQSTKAIDAVYENMATSMGMSLSDFRLGTSNIEEFNARVAGAQSYTQWEGKRASLREKARFSGLSAEEAAIINGTTTNPYSQFKGWDVFRVDGEKYKSLVDLIVQRDSQISQMYSMQGQAYRTMNRVTGGGGGRGATGGKGGGGSAAPVIAESLTELQLLEQHLKVVSGVMKAYAYGSEDWSEANMERLDTMERISKLKGESMGVGVSMSEGLDNREDFLRKALEPLNKAIIQKDKGDERTEMKLSDAMSSVAGGVSQMVSGIEGLGIKIPKGMKDVLGGIQSVVSVLTGISTIITAIEAISAVDAIIPFAHGGVVKAAGGVKVPGRHFSGDRVPALLSSGESVFNMAQTGLIYNAIMSGRGSGGSSQPYVDGEKIWLGVSNYLRRSGKGEIVTSHHLM